MGGANLRGIPYPRDTSKAGGVLPLHLVMKLFSQSETGYEASVSLDVCFSEVLEKVSSLTYHLQQTSSRVMVLMVLLEVLVKIVDPVSEDSNLDLRGTCIAFCCSVLSDDLLFLLFCKHKNKLLFLRSPALRSRRRHEPLRRGYSGYIG